MIEGFEILTSDLVRNVLLGSVFLFLLFIIFRKEQDARLNWAMFYSFLWVFCALFLVNGLSVRWQFWSFSEESVTLIPHDLFFDWVVFWGVVVPFLMKGRYLVMTAIFLLWLDVLFMPLLAKIGVLHLGTNWLVGEVLLILVVFIPSQLWFRFSYEDKLHSWRSFFQVLVMAFMVFIGIPFLGSGYQLNTFSLSVFSMAIWAQIIFAISLPSLIAVVDLVEKGQGTPFPYDETKTLVRSGVYAYIRNPIQWSLTLLFVPLAILYQSPLLFLGGLVSIAYMIGVSNPHEKIAMNQRYGRQWKQYQKSVPAWYFKWHPTTVTPAKIYFNKNCVICSSLGRWIARRKPYHLELLDASRHDLVLGSLQYENAEGVTYSSIKALASSFEHINLAWASLGWLMRLPVVSPILQIIVDTMGIGESCDVS